VTLPTTRVRHVPDPANPGWHSWDLVDDTRFNGQVLSPLLVRRETGSGGAGMIRLRMQPQVKHTNLIGGVHGGAILALADVALFAAVRILLDGDSDGAVTLDMTSQFLGTGRIGLPLDATCEVLHETGRLVFLRGLVEQDGELVAAFSATVRKASPPR